MLIPSGPANARLMIVLDCVSYRDLQANLILSDREFDRILSDAGVTRAETFITALIRDQIPGQDFERLTARIKREITPKHILHDNLHVLPAAMDARADLLRSIDLVKPKIVLTLGNGPLWALTGKSNPGAHPSSQPQPRKVIISMQSLRTRLLTSTPFGRIETSSSMTFGRPTSSPSPTARSLNLPTISSSSLPFPRQLHALTTYSEESAKGLSNSPTTLKLAEATLPVSD